MIPGDINPLNKDTDMDNIEYRYPGFATVNLVLNFTVDRYPE